MVLVLFCFCAFISQGQDPVKKLKAEADRYYTNKKYPEALNLFLKYQRVKSIDNDVRYKMGHCYLENNEPAEARKFLAYVIENAKKPKADAYYGIARTYHVQEEFEKAALAYKAFLAVTKKGHRLRESAKDDIKRCVNGFNIRSVSGQVIVENLGEYVNSKGDDFGPILSPNYKDKIYFSSSRDGNVGGLRGEDGTKKDRYGQYKTDILFSSVENGQWGHPAPLGDLINGSKNDVILGFNSTGQVMYYFNGVSLFSGEILVDTFSAGAPPVIPARFSSPMIAENGDNFPYFFNDTIMLFSSNRKGGYGGMDLYITENKNGQWMAPKNLGSRINSAYDEVTPFLSADGRSLYFSSNNVKGIGGHDVYKSVFIDKKQSWSEPENAGVPLNSAGDEMHFKLSKDGMKSFFSSSRLSSFGKRDIYIGYFNAAKAEQTVRSNPLVFSQVEVDLTAGVNLPGDGDINTGFSENEIVTYNLEQLLFERSDDVLTLANIRKLDAVARMMLAYPRIIVELNSHSAVTGSPKFDLYNSAKRADVAAKYLIEKGIPADNVLVKGCGISYPVANFRSEGGVNLMAAKLNKRINFRFHHTSGLPIKINVEDVKVSSFMKSDKWSIYDKTINGLSYKVQIASMKQMYNGDVVSNYPNASIESTGRSDYNQYTVGLYKSYYSAETLRKELEQNGLPNVFVVPYVNGLRASIEDAKIYANAFPDLQNYLRGIGEN